MNAAFRHALALFSDPEPLTDSERWALGLAFGALAWLFIRAIGQWDAVRKVVRKNVLRLDRVERDVVQGFRKGREYPPLPDDETD